MKVRIKGDAEAEARIDMRGFRETFRNTLNLQESVSNNFTVIRKGRFDEEYLFDTTYLGLDWGKIIDMMPHIKKDEMLIRYYEITYENKTEYKPMNVTHDGRELTFEKTTTDGADVLMVNSFMASADFDIKSWLNSTTYNFGLKRWKLTYEK